jgi:hypothetical protein
MSTTVWKDTFFKSTRKQGANAMTMPSGTPDARKGASPRNDGECDGPLATIERQLTTTHI